MQISEEELFARYCKVGGDRGFESWKRSHVRHKQKRQDKRCLVNVTLRLFSIEAWLGGKQS